MPQLISTNHEQVWPCAAQLLLWQCVLSLPDPSAGSPTCPHSLVPNTGWTGGQFDASRNDKSQINLWLNYSKKLHGTYIRGGSDKEQADRLHAGQINLNCWKKSAFLFPLCTI